MIYKLQRLLFSPLFLSVLLYLALQIPILTLASGLFDEGYFLYIEHLIAQGQIPYRDFFMTTSPLAYYVVAFWFHFVGEYIIIGRILGLCIGLGTLYISNLLFHFERPWKYLYLISLALLTVAPTKSIFYNDAIIFVFIALYFIIEGTEKKSRFLFIAAGICSGIAFLFKQSIGGLLIPAFILGIVFVSNTRERIQNSFAYGFSSAFVIGVCAGYFLVNRAFLQALYYIFIFAGDVKNHESSFVVHRLVVIPIIVLFVIIVRLASWRIRILLTLGVFIASIFYFSLNLSRIGRLLTYLPDPRFYAETLWFLFPVILLGFTIGRKDILNRRLTLVAIAYLVIFIAIAGSGYGSGPALAVYPLFVALVVYVAKRATSYTFIVKSIAVTIICGYTAIFAWNPFFNPQFEAHPVSQYTASIKSPAGAFIRYTPSEARDINSVVSYVQQHTKSNEKIFCFPYCPGLYVLTERDGGSYFSLFWFEAFMTNDQQMVISDLQKNHVKLIILQKTGDLQQTATREDVRLPKLYEYLIGKYKQTFENRNFIVLRLNKLVIQ